MTPTLKVKHEKLRKYTDVSKSSKDLLVGGDAQKRPNPTVSTPQTPLNAPISKDRARPKPNTKGNLSNGNIGSKFDHLRMANGNKNNFKYPSGKNEKCYNSATTKGYREVTYNNVLSLCEKLQDTKMAARKTSAMSGNHVLNNTFDKYNFQSKITNIYKLKGITHNNHVVKSSPVKAKVDTNNKRGANVSNKLSLNLSEIDAPGKNSDKNDAKDGKTLNKSTTGAELDSSKDKEKT
jgi:hypothetical protein